MGRWPPAGQLREGAESEAARRSPGRPCARGALDAERVLGLLRLLLVRALAELLDELRVEGRQVLRLRLVTSPPSTTHSSSTHVPPAFRMSVWSDGHDVSLRPLTTPASTSVHGPWQMAPTGFTLSKNFRMKSTACSSIRSKSGFATPPGRTSPS